MIFLTLVKLIIFFVSEAIQLCADPIKRGHSEIKDIWVLPNGNFRTLEFFGKIKTYSPTQSEPIEVDDFGARYGDFTNMNTGSFVSDSEVLYLNLGTLYSYNLSTKTRTVSC